MNPRAFGGVGSRLGAPGWGSRAAAPLALRCRTLLIGDRVSGADSACLTLSRIEPEDAGDYAVEVVTPSGSVTSATAHLGVGAPTAFLSRSAIANGWFQVDFAGEPGRQYRIEASPDATFASPALITNFYSGQGIIRVIDFEGATFPTRFYRAVGGEGPGP